MFSRSSFTAVLMAQTRLQTSGAAMSWGCSSALWVSSPHRAFTSSFQSLWMDWRTAVSA